MATPHALTVSATTSSEAATPPAAVTARASKAAVANGPSAAATSALRKEATSAPSAAAMSDLHRDATSGPTALATSASGSVAQTALVQARAAHVVQAASATPEESVPAGATTRVVRAEAIVRVVRGADLVLGPAGLAVTVTQPVPRVRRRHGRARWAATTAGAGSVRAYRRHVRAVPVEGVHAPAGATADHRGSIGGSRR
jgi:hypothetical protein